MGVYIYILIYIHIHIYNRERNRTDFLKMNWKDRYQTRIMAQAVRSGLGESTGQ